MRHAFWVGLLALVGCDDHLYPAIGEGGLQASYSSDWQGAQDFMHDQCESCHPSLNEPTLPDDIAGDIANGTNRYVVPGDPMASELYLVVIDQSQQTSIMPLGIAEPLPAAVTDPLAEWIANGATLD